MTEDEIIEVNRDVNCGIYAARYGKLAGETAPGLYVTLRFDAVVYHSLAALIGANLKGQAVIHLVNIQAPLPDEEPGEPEKAEQPRLGPTAAALKEVLEGVKERINAGEIENVRMSVDGKDHQPVKRPAPRLKIRDHAFRPGEQEQNQQEIECFYCKKQRDAHAQTMAADVPHVYTGRSDRDVCELCDMMPGAACHPHPFRPLVAEPDTCLYCRDLETAPAHTAFGQTATMDALLAGAQDNGAAPPKDDELTDEQREARAKLAQTAAKA